MNSQQQPAIADLVTGLGQARLIGDPDTRVSSVVYDSRQASDGSFFVALRGSYADGHDFLPMALANGAVAAIVEPETSEDAVQGFPAVVRVENTRAALARIAAKYYEHPSRQLTTIGVTGTDGKTTTTYFIEHMLRSVGRSTGLIGTVAIRMTGKPDRSAARQTTPESLDTQCYLAEMRDAGIDAAILEVTSHGLAMHRLDGCDFDLGVVTNVTREHLDFHGTVENYRAAKGSLLKRVSDARHRGKLSVCVLNADDEGARSLAPYAGDRPVLWYSMVDGSDAQVQARNLRVEPSGSEFELVTPEGRAEVRIQIPGRWNVANALAAAATGHALGLQSDVIAAGLGGLAAVPGRMERIDAGQPFHVLVDYAHTPEALRSVLVEARAMNPTRILVLFGSAGERDLQKRGEQGAIAIEHADYAIFTSEDPRFEDPDKIIQDIACGAIRVGGIQSVDFDCIEDRSLAIRSLMNTAAPGDVVILAGKGHESSMIYGSEQRPWNEPATARAALRALGCGS